MVTKEQAIYTIVKVLIDKQKRDVGIRLQVDDTPEQAKQVMQEYDDLIEYVKEHLT